MRNNKSGSVMKRRGFSLIEVLIAVFLVVLCAMIVGATMPIATASREKSDLLTKATGLAQKQLEAIRGVGYPNVVPSQLVFFGLIDNVTPVATNTYSFTNADSAVFDNPANVLPNGVGRLRIEQLEIDLRRVTVEVTYNDRGTTRTARLATLIANL